MNCTSLLASTLAISLALAGCGTAQPAGNHSNASEASSTASVLRFGYIASKGNTPGDPIGWAVKTGLIKKYYAQLGISDIQFTPFVNGPDLVAALQGGSIDAGELGDTPAVNAEANGYQSDLIDFTNLNQEVWLVTKKNGPKTLQDLKGQTVATSPGSYMSRYLLTLLKNEGLSQQVKVDPIYPADAESALQSGRIAAYAAPTDTGPQLQQLGFPVIDKASEHQLTGTSVTVASPKFVTAHPNFAKAWVEMTEASVSDIRQHADEYYQFASDASGFPVDIVKASSPISNLPTTQFPTQGIQSLNAVEQFLLQQGLAKNQFSIQDWEVK